MNIDQARDAVLTALTRIAPESDPAQLAPDARLREELDLDSMDVLSLVQLLRDATGVEIPESDYGQTATIERLTRYLAARSATPA